MRQALFTVAICAAMFVVTAYAREPALSWSVQRLDAAGAPVLQEFGQSNLDAANLQARTLCDKSMASRMGWPETPAVLVTVRPINAAPEDPRKKVATVPCADYERNPRALEAYISRPQSKPQAVKPMNIWD